MAKKKKKEIVKYNCNECICSRIYNEEVHCLLRMVTPNDPTEYSKIAVVSDCNYYKSKNMVK